MSQYYNDELAHFGIKGMKWGVRRYQKKDGSLTRAGKRQLAKQEYDNDIAAKAKELKSKSEKYYKKSDFYKWQVDQISKKGYFDYEEYDHSKKDPNHDKAEKYERKANVLDKNFVKVQAAGSAIVSSFYIAPVAGFIASKKTNKTGAAKAAVVLGSAFGSVAVSTLINAASANKQRKKEIESLGIKSVNDRIKDMR